MSNTALRRETESAGPLDHFRLLRFRFVAEALEPISLPPYKGSALRGAFGHALRRAACTTRQDDCTACLLRPRCAYPYIFEKGSQDEAPHPFVLDPPLTDRPFYGRGELLEWELVLIGNGIDALAYFIYAFSEMGRTGLGQGKGRYHLMHVDALRPAQSDRCS